MTVLCLPYDIWKITSKPECYLQNNHPSEWQFSIHLTIFEKITSKPECYSENNHPSECQFSIHLMIFEKLPQNPNDTYKITSLPNDSSLFTLLYFKYNLKTRMIPRILPPLRMTFLYSPFEILKITSKPE